MSLKRIARKNDRKLIKHNRLVPSQLDSVINVITDLWLVMKFSDPNASLTNSLIEVKNSNRALQ